MKKLLLAIIATIALATISTAHATSPQATITRAEINEVELKALVVPFDKWGGYITPIEITIHNSQTHTKSRISCPVMGVTESENDYILSNYKYIKSKSKGWNAIRYIVNPNLKKPLNRAMFDSAKFSRFEICYNYIGNSEVYSKYSYYSKYYK